MTERDEGRGPLGRTGLRDHPAQPPEAVDHPAHYGGAEDPYEAIKVIEAWRLGFCLGNTVKYIARAGKKGDEIEDLRKASWYLLRRIARLEERARSTRKQSEPAR